MTTEEVMKRTLAFAKQELNNYKRAYPSDETIAKNLKAAKEVYSKHKNSVSAVKLHTQEVTIPNKKIEPKIREEFF